MGVGSCRVAGQQMSNRAAVGLCTSAQVQLSNRAGVQK